ncbi:MAG TPA: glucose 1-dehydrogenase [Chloroflexota bacterium]
MSATELEGQVALVTGAASGIGRAIARRFAASGARVVVADVDEVGARATVDEIAERHEAGRSLAAHCDVRDEESVAAAVRRAVDAYGRLDVVVANAGVAFSAAVEDTSLADWQRVIEVNLTGAFLTAREAFRAFKAQGRGGCLLFIASKAGLAAGPGSGPYAASKAAVLHLARVLAEEGGPVGIRVNTIAPDAVFRGSQIWQQTWREQRARFYGIASEAVEEHYRQRRALKVLIDPEDVAEAALFLASHRAAKITGAVLTVDGGVATAYVR